MAFGSIELTTISRAQDYSTIKQQEDNKGMVTQSNVGHQIEKNAEQKAKEVNQRDNVDWNEKNKDARDEGSGSYQGDGGRKQKKQQPKEQVIVKGRGGFDIKI